MLINKNLFVIRNIRNIMKNLQIITYNTIGGYHGKYRGV